MPVGFLHAACLVFSQLTPTQAVAPEPQILQPIPLREQPLIRAESPTPAGRPPAPPMRLTPDEQQEGSVTSSSSLGQFPAAQQLTPLVLVHDAKVQTSAAAVIEAALRPPAEQPLAGEPVSLLAVLQRVRTGEQQLTAVKSYWRLSVAVASYHFAVDEADFLTDVAPPSTAHEASVLASRRAAAVAAQAAARLAAIRAQHDLANVSFAPGGESPPLPAEVPFVGRYQTRADALLANQAPAGPLLQIDRELPHLRHWIDSLSAATAAARVARDALCEAYQNGQTSLASLLASHNELCDQRRAFLASVLDYNQRIAEYALSVAAPGIHPETVVSMLIETQSPDRSVLVPSRGVQPASVEQPLQAVPQVEPPGEQPASPFRDVTPR